MKTFFWVITLLSSMLGGFIAFVGVVFANGAPQEASAAAIGMALAIIPYCIARAVSEIDRK